MLAAAVATRAAGCLPYRSVTASPRKQEAHPATPDAAFWSKVGTEFMMADDVAYMNNGTLGPIPRSVFAALVDGYRALATDPATHNPEQHKLVDGVRAKVAAFLGANADEIALTRNTTEGMNFVANGIDLKAGDEVLLTFHEHPGGLEPWRLKAKRTGIVIRELPFPIPMQAPSDLLNIFSDAITPRTKVISVSHMTYQTGAVLPVKALASLARSKGIITVVDGAHPLGMIRLDLHDLGVDAYASSGHKWLTAPSGTGVLYLRREFQDRIWPTVTTSGWDVPASGSRRFDRLSQQSWPLILAVGAAIDFQSSIGTQRIENRVRDLSGALRARLEEFDSIRVHTPVHPDLNAALTAFTFGALANRDVVRTLWVRHRIRVRQIEAGLNAVRVSTHYYNTEDHLQRLIEGLTAIEKHGIASQ